MMEKSKPEMQYTTSFCPHYARDLFTSDIYLEQIRLSGCLTVYELYVI